MKKIIMIIGSLLFLSAANAAIVGSQNDTEAAFYEGKTKVASWAFNADGSIDVQGNTINGEVKVYYGTGDKQRFVVYKIKDNKIEDGVYTWTYKSGEPAGEETYNKGRRDGTYKFLYKSGKTSAEGAYKDGKKEGLIKLYFESGILAQEGTYKDGKKHGEFTLYYPKGETKERTNYVYDIRHGEYQLFFASGTLKMEGQYKNNLKDGNFLKYFESGEDAGIQTYKNGVLISGESDPEADFVEPAVLE